MSASERGLVSTALTLYSFLPQGKEHHARESLLCFQAMSANIHIHGDWRCMLLMRDRTPTTDLDGLASISESVDFVEDDAIVLVALGHVSSHRRIYELSKLLQDDLHHMQLEPLSPIDDTTSG